MSNLQKADRRRTRKKALRSEAPTESSATRDSMGGPRRNWGVGQNIDHKGSQDNEAPMGMWDRAGIQDDCITNDEFEQLIEAMDIMGGFTSGEE